MFIFPKPGAEEEIEEQEGNNSLKRSRSSDHILKKSDRERRSFDSNKRTTGQLIGSVLKKSEVNGR